MIQLTRTRPLGFAASMRTLLLFLCVAPLVDHFAGAAVSDIPQLQAAAKNGYIPQEIELAAAYFTGSGVTRDAKQAAYWYQKAAESGDPEAAKEIGFFYQAGIGVPIDPLRAVHWYQLAAASGLVSAKVNLGVMYVWGIGLPKNEALAAQLFQEAASRGDGTGASYLGDLYYFGIGMEQDKAAAERWYEAGAIHSLGLLLVNHSELAKSQQEALSMLEAAANAGSWKSSVVLGVLARDGKGVPEDSKAAYYHFQVAVLQGGEPAMRLVRNDVSMLSKKLGTQQTDVLDSNISIWYQQHHLALLFVYRTGDKRERFPASALAVSVNGMHAGQLLSTPLS
jgi:TPR repeat protein